MNPRALYPMPCFVSGPHAMCWALKRWCTADQKASVDNTWGYVTDHSYRDWYYGFGGGRSGTLR